MTFRSSITYDWVSNSALFHTSPHCIFIKDKLAFQVDQLTPDFKSVITLENQGKVKKSIFSEIKNRYNKRLMAIRNSKYHLTFPHLSDSDISNLSLRNMKISKSEPGVPDPSGTFRIYPRTFVCSQCNTFYFFKNGPTSNKCHCKGSLEQVSILKFCPDCGKIDEVYASCSKCQTKGLKQGTMKLLRKSKDSISTWRWRCQNGHVEDILNAYCNHQDYRNKENPWILPQGTPSTKFKVLAIRENAIFSPAVITVVDIKDSKNIKNIEQLDLILFGIAMNYFDSFLDEARKEDKTLLEFINSKYEQYYSENKKKIYVDAIKSLADFPASVLEKKYREYCKMDEIGKIISDLEKNFPPDSFDQEAFNNYNALRGVFSEKSKSFSKSYSEEVIDDDVKNSTWVTLKKTFKINDIRYLEKIRLITASIGFVRGIKMGEDYVPHFEPFWNDPLMINRDKFSAYINPYETEGLLIDFDKKEVFEWLKKNNLISTENTKKSSEEFMFSISEDSKEYEILKTLLHTLSHVLIKKSAIHTGIDPNSCSEMIFINNCSILIYSTSNINIGGFGHVFENYILDLLKESDYELRQCIYDPICNSNDGSKGSCFSCLYLPEHVCRYNNQFLDRDILKAEWRFREKFWKEQNG